MAVYKEELIRIFQDTMKLSQPYANETAEAIRNSILYEPDDVKYAKEIPRGYKTVVTVEKGTTVGAGIEVKRKHKNDKVAILNFASAKHPGGMVVKGSVAQEECICRCSNLYSILSDNKFKKGYYDYHTYQHNKLYTSKLIYTPGVIVFKDDSNNYNKLKDIVKLDVITCAAPNLRSLSGKVDMTIVRNNDMREIYYDRIKHIFKAAATNKVDHLILGAFGCGVFKNSPNDIARAFHEVQDEFDGCFKSIVYSIYCGTDKSSVNYDVFNTEFK